MEGGFVEGQVMDGGPEIEDVAVGATLRVEALKDIPAQMQRKGSLSDGGWAVEGTASATLLASATQLVEQAEVP